MKDQVLRTAHGERRNDNLAAGRLGIAENRQQFITGFVEWPVIVVAVSRFEQYDIRRGWRDRIEQDRRVERPNVARKDNRDGSVSILHGHLNASRSQNVAGVDELDANAVGNRFHHVVIERREARQRACHVFGGIEGLPRDFVSAKAAHETGIIFLLQVGRIAENDFRNLGRWRGAMNGAGITTFDQHRKSAAMVEVGMRQDDRVQLAQVDGGMRRLCSSATFSPWCIPMSTMTWARSVLTM